MVAVDLPLPRRPGETGEAVAVPAWVRVFDAGLACCAVEVSAALRRCAGQLPGDATVNVLVVAGTVTDKLAPLVLAAYRDLPAPRRVLSFGACSTAADRTGTPTA
jgi:NADH:ubiquinone oxidoreductase subunit B-like Fe-S oxidoreductase